VSSNSILIGDTENLRYIIFKIIIIYIGLGVFYAGMLMRGSMGCRVLVVLLWRTWRLSCSIGAWSDLIMTIQFLDG
jgi:hypothetical protein